MPARFVILSVALPLLVGVVSLLLHDFKRTQKAVGVVGLVGNFAFGIWALLTVCPARGETGVVLATQMGNWPAPFGISVVVDTLSAMMLLTSGLLALAVYVYALFQLPRRFSGGYFHPLFHFLMLGVNWAFVTGDLFNLFVSFEIMLMASYALLVVGTTRVQMRSAYKYVLLNLLASTLFVVGCGFVYGQLGTLNFAEIAVLSRTGQLPREIVPVVALLAVVFASKAAGFPLWFWLPDTYPTLPPALGGLFAGLLTKVGVYALIRVLLMAFGGDADVRLATGPAVLVCAGASMLLGVLGAVSGMQMRRILATLVISHVGYILLGVGLATTAALAATMMYVVQHMIVKCALFLCTGLVIAHDGTDDLGQLGGLFRRAPWLSALFLVAALSLIGLPPLSGFHGKFLLVQESFAFGEFAGYGFPLAIVAIVAGVLTLITMTKVWGLAFWGSKPATPATPLIPAVSEKPTTGGWLAAAFLVICAVAVGLGAQVVLDYGETAARGVLEPAGYVEAVLGGEAAALLPSAEVSP